MKKTLLILSVSGLLFTNSCSKTPDIPVGDVSIESAEDGKVLIRIKPKVGDSQKMLMTMDMSSEESFSMNMRFEMDMKVVDATEPVYTYEVKYNNIKMDMSAGGVQLNYDSNSKEQNPMTMAMHNELKPFFEKPFTMKMNDRGKVTDFQMPGTNMNQKMDMDSFSIPLPEEAVGVGDSWTDVRQLQNVGNMKMTMTLDKITVDDIIISTKGKIESNGTTIGGFTGSYTLARNNGFTKDGTMDMKMSVEGQNLKMKVNFKPL